MSPSPGKFRSSLLFTIMALIAVNALVVTLLLNMSSLVGGEDLEVAQRFMKAIEIGSGFVTEAREQTGYEAAWELLGDDLRAETSAHDFLSFFESRITDHGFIDSWYREPEESGSMGDRHLNFIVHYREPEGAITRIRYQLHLEKDEVYAVTEFAADGPLADLGQDK